jgi:hypothetical protein
VQQMSLSRGAEFGEQSASLEFGAPQKDSLGRALCVVCSQAMCEAPHRLFTREGYYCYLLEDPEGLGKPLSREVRKKLAPYCQEGAAKRQERFREWFPDIYAQRQEMSRKVDMQVQEAFPTPSLASRFKLGTRSRSGSSPSQPSSACGGRWGLDGQEGVEEEVSIRSGGTRRYGYQQLGGQPLGRSSSLKEFFRRGSRKGSRDESGPPSPSGLQKISSWGSSVFKKR